MTGVAVVAGPARGIGAATVMPAAYRASKAGVTGLIRALAVELRETGVTANAVSPGSTAIPILGESAPLYGLESAEALLLPIADCSLIPPEEAAAAIAWLADAATAGITGAAVQTARRRLSLYAMAASHTPRVARRFGLERQFRVALPLVRRADPKRRPSPNRHRRHPRTRCRRLRRPRTHQRARSLPPACPRRP